MFKVTGRIFTIANFISLTRVLLVGPILIFLKRGTPEANWIALVLMVIAALTDFLDGFFARLFDQRSDLGRIIDPVADKVGIGAVAIILSRTHGLPLWFLILIISRDLAILGLSFVFVSRSKKIPESNWYGKIAVTGMAVVVILFTLNIEVFKWIALYLTVGLIVVSVVSYLQRFWRLFAGDGDISGASSSVH